MSDIISIMICETNRLGIAALTYMEYLRPYHSLDYRSSAFSETNCPNNLWVGCPYKVLRMYAWWFFTVVCCVEVATPQVSDALSLVEPVSSGYDGHDGNYHNLREPWDDG